MNYTIKSILSEFGSDIRYFRDRISTKLKALYDIQFLYLNFRFTRKKQFAFISDYQRFLKTSSPASACKAMILGVQESGDEPLKEHVARSILLALDNGEKANVGMERWFNIDLLQIYRAAEESKDVTKVLDVYIKQEKNNFAFKKSLFGSLFGPLYISTIALVISVAAARTKFFGFEDITPVNKWEPISLYARDLSIFLDQWISLIFILLFIASKLYRYLADHWTGSERLYLDRFFPLKIYKTFAFLRIFKLIAALKSTKKGDYDTIEVAHQNGTPYTRYFTGLMKQKMNRGEENLGAIMDTGLLPPRMISRIRAVAELSSETTRLKALVDISKDAEAEADIMLGRSKILISLFSWVFAGAFIGITLAGFALVAIGNTSL